MMSVGVVSGFTSYKKSKSSLYVLIRRFPLTARGAPWSRKDMIQYVGVPLVVLMLAVPTAALADGKVGFMLLPSAPAVDQPAAAGSVKIPINRLREAVLAASFPGGVKAFAPDPMPNARTSALAVRMTFDPPADGEMPYLEYWTIDGPAVTSANLALAQLWPGQARAGNKLIDALRRHKEGDKLTFAVRYAEERATGAMVQLQDGRLVPEYVWKYLGADPLATITVELMAPDVAIPSDPVVVAATENLFRRYFATKWPESMGRDADVDVDYAWWMHVSARVTEALKPLPDKDLVSVQPGNAFKSVAARFGYKDLRVTTPGACVPSAAAGFMSCTWGLSARLIPAGVTARKPRPKVHGLFGLGGGGGEPAWTPWYVPLDCTWKMQARVENTKAALQPTQSWFSITCKSAGAPSPTLD